MFKDASAKWTAEFYEHYAAVEEHELKTEKRTLKSKNDMEFIFQNFSRSHILDLPSLSEFEWKLVTRGNVEKVKRKYRGEDIEEYELISKRLTILDGENFYIYVKGWKKENQFEFSNPDTYLTYYPDIDELIYMCEILNVIRNEFEIWEK